MSLRLIDRLLVEFLDRRLIPGTPAYERALTWMTAWIDLEARYTDTMSGPFETS